MIAVSNSSASSAFSALVLPTPIPTTFPALSSACYMNSVHLVVRMPLWTVRASEISIALVLSLLASATLSMTSLGIDVRVFFGVLMPLWAMGDIGLPTQSIIDHVSTVLTRGTPVQIAQLVIFVIVIAMATLHSLGALTFKRHQHEHMNQELSADSVAIEGAGPILSHIITRQGLLKNSPLENSGSAPSAEAFTVKRSNPPLVGSRIAGVAGDGQPSFVVHNREYNTSKRKALQCL